MMTKRPPMMQSTMISVRLLPFPAAGAGDGGGGGGGEGGGGGGGGMGGGPDPAGSLDEGETIADQGQRFADAIGGIDDANDHQRQDADENAEVQKDYEDPADHRDEREDHGENHVRDPGNDGGNEQHHSLIGVIPGERRFLGGQQRHEEKNTEVGEDAENLVLIHIGRVGCEDARSSGG